ncbi:hypothetical protein EV368DRAFT_79333 [Lentinula lateritia]|nr:hypothetical protein EV368DRAFT_79333 [Lentinula lateritia]
MPLAAQLYCSPDECDIAIWTCQVTKNRTDGYKPPHYQHPLYHSLFMRGISINTLALAVLEIAIISVQLMRVSAMPFVQQQNLPDILHPSPHLKFFPGKNLIERRDAASNCQNLSVNDLKQLPGFNNLVQKAKDKHGNGKYTIKTNDDHFPGNPALICVHGPAEVTYNSGTNKSPYCQPTTADAQGTLTGTNGTVAVTVLQGVQTTAQYTISSAASIGLSDMFQTQVGFPAITDLFDFFTTSVTITNTQTQSFMTQHTAQTTLTLTMASVEGDKCEAKEVVQQCTIPSTGKIQLVAQGTAWWEYESRTGDNDNKNAGKHYAWMLDINELPIHERSAHINFVGNMQVVTKGNYNGGNIGSPAISKAHSPALLSSALSGDVLSIGSPFPTTRSLIFNAYIRELLPLGCLDWGLGCTSEGDGNVDVNDVGVSADVFAPSDGNWMDEEATAICSQRQS